MRDYYIFAPAVPFAVVMDDSLFAGRPCFVIVRPAVSHEEKKIV